MTALRAAGPAVAQARSAAAFVVTAAVLLALLTRYQVVAPDRLLLLALGTPVCAWLAFTNHKGWALAAIAIYLGLLDGPVKLGSGNENAGLLRDVLLYSMAVGLLVRATVRAETMRLPPYSAWPLAFAAIALTQLANPLSAAVPFGDRILALRPLVEFIPLFFMAYAYVDSLKALERFLMLLVVIGGLNGVAGLAQSVMSIDQLASLGPGYSNLVYGEGTFEGAARTFVDSTGTARARPPALGSDLGYGGVIGAAALPAALALLAGASSRRTKVFAALGIAATATAVVTSQSRLPVVAAIVAAVAYPMLTAGTRQRATATLAVIGGLGLAVLSISVLVESTGSNLVDRYSTITPSSILATSTLERAGTYSAFADLITRVPLGGGLAQSGPAGRLRPQSTVVGYNAENTLNYLLVETGILGMVVFVGGALVLLIRAMFSIRRVPDIAVRRNVAALISALIGLTVVSAVGSAYAGTPGGPLLWACSGVLVGLVGGRSSLLRSTG